MISDEYFFNLSQRLAGDTESFILSLLDQVKANAIQLVNDPSNTPDIDAESRKVAERWQAYQDDVNDWVDENIPKAYRQGLQQAASNLPSSATLTVGSFLSVPLFGGESMEISPKAAEALKDIPQHHSMYSVFQKAAYDDFASTRIPVIRSTTDKIRDLVVEASDQAYREADTLTRRELSQSIMNRLADDGITGVKYSNGRTMKLDSYAEMVARSQTGNAARQAHINRMQEYGRDLILISQHYPVSPLCEPWQGRVYSLSGSSENYPPLQEAISNGLYHANCKHSQSSYVPGQSIPEAREKVDKRENERRYQAQNQQRYNERQIRGWKRRKQVALTEDERQRAQAKISEWQKRQRELLDGEDWMRRQYAREQL